MKVQNVLTELLKENVGQITGLPKNPRIIKSDNYKKLLQSLKDDPDFMNARELLAVEFNGEYVVFAGNMRLKACRELGWKEIPTKVFPSDFPIDKIKRYVIKDNASFGENDWELMANEWDAEELSDWGVDLPDDFLKNEVVEDEPPEVSEEPAVSILGNVYKLGRHRLMCGDSTKIEDVEKLMDGKKADMVFTDPPYNLSFNGGTRKDKFDTLINDDISIEDWDTFIDTSLANILMFCNGAVYVCIDWRNYSVVFPKMSKLWKIYNCIVWVKNQLSMGMRYRFRHEFIIYADNSDWQGKHSLTDVWDEDKDAYKEYKHPTQKPIALIARAVNNSSKIDNIVLDLFGGSGSTLIACEQTNRTCYMCELDEKYVDVIRKRYWMFTHDGKEDGWAEGTLST
ncbi:MAG: DNA modification methylase [Patescibacteria group bacterium]